MNKTQNNSFILIATHWVPLQGTVSSTVLSLDRMWCVSEVFDQVNKSYMTMVWGGNEILHPRIIRICPKVHLKVTKDLGEWLEVHQESLLRPLLLQLWLRVSHQLFNVEDASYSCFNFVL